MSRVGFKIVPRYPIDAGTAIALELTHKGFELPADILLTRQVASDAVKNNS